MKNKVIIAEDKRITSRFEGFDILKCLCAFLVVCIHCPFEIGKLDGYCIALARVAVPIFFMITGYFYTDVKKEGRRLSQLKKIIVLTIMANTLYAVWNSMLIILSGDDLISYWDERLSLNCLLKFLVLNESPFASHLWYLSALIYVLVIVYVLDLLQFRKILYFIFPFFLIGDLILGKYSLFLFGYEFSYILVRNFIFVGIPYFTIGMLIRKSREKIISMRESSLIIFIIVFIGTTLGERFMLIHINCNATRDHYISTTLLAVTLFMFFLKYFNNKRIGRLGKAVAWIGRKYSSGIYIIHPMLQTIVFVFVGVLGLREIYICIAPIVIFPLSVIVVTAVYKITQLKKI